MKLSPEDAVKALEFLGVDAENLDGFKTKFAEGYIPVSRVEQYVKDEPDGKIKNAIIGNTVGQFNDAVSSVAKRFEIDLSSEDFKGLEKQSEKLKKLAEVVHNKIEGERQTFKSGLPDLEKVNKEWETKVSKIQKEKESIESLLNTTKTEFEGFKTEVVTKEKNSKKDSYWNKSFGSLKFSKETDDLKKEGFATKFRSKYDIDIDDKGNEFVIERESGKKLPSKKNAGNFAGLDELLELEALNYKGLLDMTPTQQQQQTKPPIFGDNNQNQNNNQQHQQPLGHHRMSDAAKRKLGVK